MFKKIIFTFLLSSIYTFAFDYNLKPVKVTNDVWCFFGKLDMPTKENGGFMSNSCYIKADKSYVLIDSGASYAFASQAYEAMSKIEKLPVSTIISTHSHDDHWLGNNFYKEKFNAKILGPSLINKEYNESSITRMHQVLSKENFKGTKIIPVDDIVNETRTLKIGNKELIIVPVGVKAHTSEDLFVYLGSEKILFTGDIAMNGRVTSNRDGSVIGSLKAIDMINSNKWDYLVAGHGLDTSKTALNEATEYFSLLKERVLEAIENDTTGTEITKVVTMDEFKDKPLYDELNSKNVYDAFRELEFYEE
ncbi:MBL fold metallo-hydrolase [Arcobacter sp. s6]|uniref:MBL fold metallo-hydrolase n=1 Tax=Arcobacter sp. s6 TaxID=3230363 RepID=UPI0034A05B32